MILQRRTLREKVEFEGKGLHSGNPVRVAIHPAETGIWFRFGAERWQAKPENVSDTSLCTKLGDIATIEHLMSAFAGCMVTDAEVEVSWPELPAMDGSALPFVEQIHRSGLVEFGQSEHPALFKRIYEHDESAKIAAGAGDGHWRYEFLSETRFPFDQVYETKNVTLDYAEQIARARTFGWEDQEDTAAEMGLAQGLTRETCLLLGSSGPVNQARFTDEPSRHKLLDAIGDLYLSGYPIQLLNVVCSGSGHKMNVMAAYKLQQFWKQ